MRTVYSTFELPKKQRQNPNRIVFVLLILLFSLSTFYVFSRTQSTLTLPPTKVDFHTESVELVARAQRQEKERFAQTSREVNLADDWTGFLFCAVFVAIAAGGGIGGGGVLVPTYIFVLGFTPKYAIPLSNITILGAAIANMICNFRKRHPVVNRPLIDWDIILMMEPLTIIGAILGTFVNILSPPWLISIMLVLLLGGTAIRTFKKGIKKYWQESAQREAEKLDLNGRSSSTGFETNYHLADGRSSFPSDDQRLPEYKPSERLIKAQEDGNATIISLLDSESTHPPMKVFIIFLITAGVLTFSLLTGDGDQINLLGIQCGDGLYWTMTLASIPYILIITYFSRQHLVHIYHLKKQCGYVYPVGDVMWNERNTIVYPLICSFAGLAAGMFGIGGGIVKGPLMLEMGTLPEVTSATSATMILFTSTSASISYFIFGKLNLHYALILFFIGLAFTFVGQLGLDYIVKKYKRNSLIILIIGFVVALSAVAMGAQSFPSIIALIHGNAEGGGSICPKGNLNPNPVDAANNDGEILQQYALKLARNAGNLWLEIQNGPTRNSI